MQGGIKLDNRVKSFKICGKGDRSVENLDAFGRIVKPGANRSTGGNLPMRRHPSLELDDLRTVVALAEELNFHRAGREGSG